MKICPTCQQQFPNGFQYCPNDTDMLVTTEDYLRRTKPIAQVPPQVEATARASENQPPVRQPAVESPKVAITEPVPPPPPPITRRQEPANGRQAGAGAPTTPIGQPATATGTGNFQQAPTARVQPPTDALPKNGAPTSAPTANGKQNAANATAKLGAASAAAATAKDEGLSFSIPESGGLVARLAAAIQNIQDAFSKGSVKPGETGDFQFLLRDESFVARLGRELQTASEDFKRDPKTFVIATIKGEGASKQRQRWILNGMASAVIAYSFLFFVLPAIYLLIWPKYNVAAEEKEPPLEMLAALTETPIVDTKVNKPKETPKGKGGFTGGSKPVVKQASGGGGGGRQTPTPPSKGVPPQMALTPQIIPPNPEPPKIKNPSLVVASTVYGDPKAIPPMKGPIGDLAGVPAPPSSGPGRGAGVGTGEGTGVGRGQGGGVGAGRGGNAGGGDMDTGGGRGNGGSGGIEEMGKNGVGRPTILYREKARYTEEARQNKVQGTVLLNVIFTAEGRITSIRVVRGLPDGLTERAIEAAQKIRFQPATKNGSPVSVRGNLEFTFNLY